MAIVTARCHAEAQIGGMTPNQIKTRRLELGLTADEMAWALNISEAELLQVEAGDARLCAAVDFDEAFALLEERLFSMMVGV